MNDTLFAKNFIFREVHRGKRAFTDARNGSPLHYVAYMVHGKCRIAAETGEIHASEGDLFYIPKGLPYRSYWQDAEDVTFLSLGFPYLPCDDGKHYPLQVLKKSAEAMELLKKVPIGGRAGADGIAALYALVAYLIPTMQESDPCRSRQIVSSTEQLLWENTDLRPTDIARRIGVCESALYAAFAKLGEGTLHDMKNKVLFGKAKELLQTTDVPIEQISDRLGFCSCAYFRKKFKEHFGITPRDMRKRGFGL